MPGIPKGKEAVAARALQSVSAPAHLASLLMRFGADLRVDRQFVQAIHGERSGLADTIGSLQQMLAADRPSISQIMPQLRLLDSAVGQNGKPEIVRHYPKRPGF